MYVESSGMDSRQIRKSFLLTKARADQTCTSTKESKIPTLGLQIASITSSSHINPFLQVNVGTRTRHEYPIPGIKSCSFVNR